MKAFLIDVTKCVGCYDCQIGCKDEHCEQAWPPYAEAQPEIGQFWCKVNQYERGANTHVKVSYVPVLGGQNEAIRKYAPEVCMDREDGLIVIDPAKAKGRKDIADKFEGVYWNEELQIPQACTGCAHLIDDPESPIRTPRCADNCHVDAIQFGEIEELDLEGAEALPGWENARVWYKGLPKKFIAATVYCPEKKEVVIGAKVTASGEAGTFTTETDIWGDFWLRGLPEADWTLVIEKDGKRVSLDVSTKDKDQGLADIALAQRYLVESRPSLNSWAASILC